MSRPSAASPSLTAAAPVSFSADEPNRLRGPQFHWAICDELGDVAVSRRCLAKPYARFAPRHESPLRGRHDAAPYGHHQGLLTDPTVAVTRGSTYENRANLAPQFFEQIVRRYEGTRIGRQEIDAEVSGEPVKGRYGGGTLSGMPPEMQRIVIGLDPAVTASESSDETGIIVCGKGVDGFGYVLDDLSCRLSADGWARHVVQAYHRWEADRIVAEVNNGGDLVELVIRTVDRNVPITKVHASRGKATTCRTELPLSTNRAKFSMSEPSRNWRIRCVTLCLANTMD